MNLTQLINDQIFDARLSTIKIEKKCVINTLNPHSYVIAKKDLAFQKALMAADILLPDGSGIVLASRILCDKKIQKIAGADMHSYLLNQANLKAYKVFYLGASETTLQLIKDRIQKDFPNIKVASYSPPFKPEFSKKETNAMINAVNMFQPDILFVGMTAPKQEKWVWQNKIHLNANIIASIGAAFDFYAGTKKRSHPKWIKLGLEWLPRFIREPIRLWRRTLISSPKFLWYVFLERIK